MALSLAEQLVNLGVPTEVAKLLGDAIGATPTSIPAANVTGLSSAVVAAMSAKPQIAALTGSSTAANIVTALQA